MIEIAILRPGPIQGDMVHPYLLRCNGEEPVEYPSKDLREILHKLLDVPLFHSRSRRCRLPSWRPDLHPKRPMSCTLLMATFKAMSKVSKLEEKRNPGMVAKAAQTNTQTRACKNVCFSSTQEEIQYFLPPFRISILLQSHKPRQTSKQTVHCSY